MMTASVHSDGCSAGALMPISTGSLEPYVVITITGNCKAWGKAKHLSALPSTLQHTGSISHGSIMCRRVAKAYAQAVSKGQAIQFGSRN